MVEIIGSFIGYAFGLIIILGFISLFLWIIAAMLGGINTLDKKTREITDKWKD